MADGYLCVGGPQDGKMFASQRPSGFVGTVLTEIEAINPNVRADRRCPTIELVQYRLETFHTPQGDVKMWAPQNQTPMETMTLLLECYAKSAQYWRNMQGQ